MNGPRLSFAVAALMAISAAAAVPQPVDAGEPELVLPQVVVRIEDPTVERVVPGMPGDQDLLPPERVPPLPALAELAVRDLQPPSALQGEPALEARKDSGLAAEAVLGAGTLSHTYGRLGIYRTGEGPRFSLRFLHEMKDGFGGEDPGAGFHRRDDQLEATVRTRGEHVELDAEGLFRDSERGLQDLGPYYARTLRDLHASADAAWLLTDRFALTGGLEGEYASDLLSGPSGGASSLSEAETRWTPGVGARYRVERFETTLEATYRYAAGIDERHRVRIDWAADWDPNEKIGLKAQVGWFWSPDLDSLFPFQVAFSGALPRFTLDASGGYRVSELDWSTLLAAHPLALIGNDTEDNRGWFADVRIGIAVAAGFSLQTRAAWAREEAMPDPQLLPGEVLDAATGLFAFSQIEAERLTMSAGLKWNPRPMVGLAAAIDAELFEHPQLEPRYLLRFDAEGSEASGRWGAGAAARFELDSGGDPSDTLLPIVDGHVFWRVSTPVTLSVEGEDLLAWLLDDPRTRLAPFVEPGTGVIFKVQINL